MGEFKELYYRKGVKKSEGMEGHKKLSCGVVLGFSSLMFVLSVFF